MTRTGHDSYAIKQIITERTDIEVPFEMTFKGKTLLITTF